MKTPVSFQSRFSSNHISARPTLIFALLSILFFALLPMQLSLANSDAPLESFLPSTCHFNGLFEQKKSLPNFPKPFKSVGQFYFDCQRGLIWLTENPFEEAVVYSHAQKHWLFEERPQSEKTNQDTHFQKPLTGRAAQGIADFLLSFLSANAEEIKRAFTVAGTAEKITLVPHKQLVRRFLQGISVTQNQPSNADRTEENHHNRVIHITIDGKDAQNTDILIYKISPIIPSENERNTDPIKHCSQIIKTANQNLMEKLCASLTTAQQT